MFASQILVSVDIQGEICNRYKIKFISLFSYVLLENLVTQILVFFMHFYKPGLTWAS